MSVVSNRNGTATFAGRRSRCTCRLGTNSTGPFLQTALSQAVNLEAHEDLSEWLGRIAVAHSRNRRKDLDPLELYSADKPAIIDAILLEAAKEDVT